jgi:ABC-type multidrug transport system fused ATPase/permease subunit
LQLSINADRIAVIEAGRLVELGNHSTLLALGGIYAQLYNEQFYSIRPLTKIG